VQNYFFRSAKNLSLRQMASIFNAIVIEIYFDFITALMNNCHTWRAQCNQISESEHAYGKPFSLHAGRLHL